MTDDQRDTEGLSPLSFTLKLPDASIATILVDYISCNIETTISNLAVSDDFASSIFKDQQPNFDALSVELQNEISFIKHTLIDATRRVIRLIKYHLRHFNISEQLFSSLGTKCGLTESALYKLPGKLSCSFDALSNMPLNEKAQKLLQTALDSEAEPLLAMRHLHRAKKEPISHHKWIDATIAAELAVKEVLSLAHPEIEPMLLELPSPPLTKLYGSLLKHYLGEKSPFLQTIRDGVETRNRLIHRPTEEQIDAQKAIDYVSTIEAAIFHLLSMLYRDDVLIQQNYMLMKPE